MRGFEKSFNEMTLSEKEGAYADMMRNCSNEQRVTIEGGGALSDDPFVRPRQELFRMIIRERNGVEFGSQPGQIIHHPV
jgi:hypothetical protein